MSAWSFRCESAPANQPDYDDKPRPSGETQSAPRFGACLGRVTALADPLFAARGIELDDASHRRVLGRQTRQPHRRGAAALAPFYGPATHRDRLVDRDRRAASGGRVHGLWQKPVRATRAAGGRATLVGASL